MQQDPRRASPRIGIEALCWEVIGEREHSSMVVDLSPEGARLERPYLPANYFEYDDVQLGPAGRSNYIAAPPRPRELERVVPLQLEIPEMDEVMWARGDIVFDELVPVKANGGPFGLMRRTGYHIALAATRDMRRLRDYVMDVHHAKLREDSMDWARCF